MKTQLVLPLVLLTSLLMLGLLKIRKRDHEKEEKRNRFQDIKLRVTSDVLQEYKKEKIERQTELEKAEGELKAMEEEVKAVQTKAEKAAGDLTGCDGSQKSGADEQAAKETNSGNLKAQMEKEKTEWNAELDRLKKQLAEKSPVCNFLKEYPDQINDMHYFVDFYTVHYFSHCPSSVADGGLPNCHPQAHNRRSGIGELSSRPNKQS
ncbi:hypothetical protein CCH79_00011008, partial [Gambusia affinis]